MWFFALVAEDHETKRVVIADALRTEIAKGYKWESRPTSDY
jgi:hypothetical protein